MHCYVGMLLNHVLWRGQRRKVVDDAMEREWCSVCLSKVMEGAEAQVLPCEHEFHKICVGRWFHQCQKQKTCPICQFWTRDEDGRTTEVLTEEMVIWFTSFHVIG